MWDVLLCHCQTWLQSRIVPLVLDDRGIKSTSDLAISATRQRPWYCVAECILGMLSNFHAPQPILDRAFLSCLLSFHSTLKQGPRAPSPCYTIARPANARPLYVQTEYATPILTSSSSPTRPFLELLIECRRRLFAARSSKWWRHVSASRLID